MAVDGKSHIHFTTSAEALEILHLLGTQEETLNRFFICRFRNGEQYSS
jgi:hypothetical protein